MSARLALALALVAPLASATPAVAGWSADRAQTRAGTAVGVHAAGGNGDRVLLGWSRHLGPVERAEVRLGRAEDGFTRSPLLLDSSTNLVEAPVSAYVRAGTFEVVWRRFASRNHRLQRKTIDRVGRPSGTVNVTTTGESASFPAWTGGPVPVLTWSRRTRADALELTPTGPSGLRLPVTPLSEPGVATGPGGLATVSWVDGGRVLVSDRGPQGFSAPVIVASREVNRTEVLRLPGGATLLFWRQDTDLMVAARPAGGGFGPPRVVLASTTDGAQVALTKTREVLVVAPVGDSSFVGELRLARLDGAGAPLGPQLSLGRGRRAALAADGTGSAFVAWMGETSARTVTARRVANGGILGPPRLLAARSDPGSSPTLAATREGGAVAAWIAGGDVHARTYRP